MLVETIIIAVVSVVLAIVVAAAVVVSALVIVVVVVRVAVVISSRERGNYQGKENKGSVKEKMSLKASLKLQSET